MYYITNQNNQIIAVDPHLLALLEVENIDALYKEIALGDTIFSLSTEDEKVTITTSQNEEKYSVKRHDLSSMLGNITLVQVQTSPETSMFKDDDDVPIKDFLTIETAEEDDTVSAEDLLPIEIAEEDEISILDDILEEVSEEEIEEDDTVPAEDLLPIETAEEDEISILDDILEEVSDKEIEKDKTEYKDELFDLLMPISPEEAIDTISTIEEENEQVKTAEESQAPIVIDAENISQSIGISTEDYNTFLNEYIDTALSLEKDLQSTKEEERSRAVATLSHLSTVLHLPVVVSQIVTEIEHAAADTQNKHIESFYTMLSRLTTSQPGTYKEELLPAVEAEAEAVTARTESFGTISLDDVKPIHFDFQLKQAAEELSLPVELIEEFVIDFIAQAHTETKNMLEAYEKGDLDTIQRIGHLLKGASSNLRIKPLSDTLYEIQFCKDSSKMEHLIKQYWGHFLSLEIQMELTTKRK